MRIYHPKSGKTAVVVKQKQKLNKPSRPQLDDSSSSKPIKQYVQLDEHNKLKRNLNTLKKTFKDVMSLRETEKRIQESLLKENELFRHQLEELRKQLKEKNETTIEVLSFMETHQDELVKLKESKTEMKERMKLIKSNHAAEVEAMELEIVELKNVNLKLTHQLSTNSNNNEDSTVLLKTLKEDNETLQKEKIELISKNEDLINKNEDLINKNEALTNTNSTLTKELTNTNTNLTEQLKTLKAENETLKSQEEEKISLACQSLEEDLLSSVKETLQEAEKECEEWKEKYHQEKLKNENNSTHSLSEKANENNININENKINNENNNENKINNEKSESIMRHVIKTMKENSETIQEETSRGALTSIEN